jgi:acetyl-CoA carboxylase alpha subunit
MFRQDETVAVLFPGEDDYAFGSVNGRTQEGWEIAIFGNENPSKADERWIKRLGKVNPQELREALQIPIAKKVITDLVS